MDPNGWTVEVDILPPRNSAKRGPERASERKRIGRSIDAHDQVGAIYCKSRRDNGQFSAYYNIWLNRLLHHSPVK
jgi:hypothetical protein